MSDESVDLRWRRQGYVPEDAPKAKLKRRRKLRPRLTREVGRMNVGDVPNPGAMASKSRAPARDDAPGIEPARKRATKPVGGATADGSVGTAAVATGLSDRRQRCIVKVSYVRHGAAKGSGGGGAAPLGAHARYLGRDGAEASDPFGQGYLTRHGQDMFGDDGRRLEEWQTDRHHFRLVISPEHADRLDMRDFTTRYMQELEANLHRSRVTTAPLEWVAVTHHNTDHLHAHVVLRGRTQDGRDLVIPKKVIAHGLRELGRDLATGELGYRLRHEIVRELERQVGMERFTELDRAILERSKRMGAGRTIDPATLDGPVRARLDWLVAQGHARPAKEPAGAITLEVDLADRLRAKGEERDIVRSLRRQQQAGGEGSSLSIQRYRKSMDAPPLVGHIEHVEPLDELIDRFGAIIRDATDKKLLVEISHGQADRLSVGDRVQVSTTRTLPNGRTTRSPFIRIENSRTGKASIAVEDGHTRSADDRSRPCGDEVPVIRCAGAGAGARHKPGHRLMADRPT